MSIHFTANRSLFCLIFALGFRLKYLYFSSYLFQKTPNLDDKMYFCIVITILVIILIIIYSKSSSHQSYVTFEEFKQLYCSSPLFNVNHLSQLSTIDMFHKCDTNHHRFHSKSSDDYLFLLDYIENFLCRTNEHINRPGPVCPFVPRSLKQQSIYFHVQPDDEIINEFELMKIIRQCRYDFLHHLEPTQCNNEKLVFKCLLVLIRSSNISHSIVDRVQTLLKPEFILQYGLMIGEFYESLNATAKHNEHFYPLRTKVPLLVIRYMVADDIYFLNQKEKYPVDIRLKFVKQYLHLYHLDFLYRSKSTHLQMANELLEELTSSIE